MVFRRTIQPNSGMKKPSGEALLHKISAGSAIGNSARSLIGFPASGVGANSANGDKSCRHVDGVSNPGGLCKTVDSANNDCLENKKSK